jgi:hypothetical protein
LKEKPFAGFAVAVKTADAVGALEVEKNKKSVQ